MELESQIKNLVIDSAKRIVSELKPSEQFEVDEDCLLLGERSSFDSISTMSFLIEVEQRVEEDYGRRISLSDEQALSQPEAPFKTVRLLTSYLYDRLRETR